MIVDFSQFRRKFPEHFEYLTLEQLDPNPLLQCKKWFEEAMDHGFLESNAMCLSTSTPKGDVSSRIVLLKYLDEKGFVFFTNYKSRKAKDLENNPRASAVFHWPLLNRQLIITASVEKLSNEASFEYFKTRPRQNKLLAWASNQDEEIQSTEIIFEKMKAVDQMYASEEIPLPLYWGGFRLLPQKIEFWQGGPARVNQRFVFTLTQDVWKSKQLSP